MKYEQNNPGEEFVVIPDGFTKAAATINWKKAALKSLIVRACIYEGCEWEDLPTVKFLRTGFDNGGYYKPTQHLIYIRERAPMVALHEAAHAIVHKTVKANVPAHGMEFGIVLSRLLDRFWQELVATQEKAAVAERGTYATETFQHSTSTQIRDMHFRGYSVKLIADKLEIRYQHAYNTVRKLRR